MEFKVGDVVDWCGVRGYIASEDADGDGFLLVMFPTVINEMERNAYFEKNGKYRNWHAEPSLKLIESPKKRKKVKKYQVLYRSRSNYYGLTMTAFESQEQFEQTTKFYSNPPTFIKLLEETMVEE